MLCLPLDGDRTHDFPIESALSITELTPYVVAIEIILKLNLSAI